MSEQLYSCDFEVFGIVQGVFFRKYTQNKAIEFGAKGWCKNTREGTVAGQMEGSSKSLQELQHWIREIGTPTSRVDKTTFSKHRPIDAYTTAKFEIRRG